MAKRMKTFSLMCTLADSLCRLKYKLSHAGDASFTAMTRMETLLNGKSAVLARSSFFR